MCDILAGKVEDEHVVRAPFFAVGSISWRSNLSSAVGFTYRSICISSEGGLGVG